MIPSPDTPKGSFAWGKNPSSDTNIFALNSEGAARGVLSNRRHINLLLLVIIIVLFYFGDLITTWIGLGTGYQEKNFVTKDFPIMVLIKTVLFMIVAVSTYCLERLGQEKLSGMIYGSAIAVGVLATANNLLVLKLAMNLTSPLDLFSTTLLP